MDALAQAENRSLHYAQDFGKALGGISVLAEYIERAQQFPEIRDDILSRAGEYANGLLAEFATKHG